MLKTLYIKNYILIDEIRIDFLNGLNVITGETGAGKSILVDALAAILGDSLSKESIRHGENKAIFEACFLVSNQQEISNLLLDNEIEAIDSELIIRRELNDSGRSRGFVNDTPVPLTVLQRLGDLLIDLHGQHEHQLLLQPARHIDYLDAFADLDDLSAQTRTAYLTLKERLKAFQTLIARKSESDKARELQQFQYQEIASVDPQEDEDMKLNQEESILRHAEKLQYAGSRWFEMLYEQDGSVTEILSMAQKELAELAPIDATFGEIAQECEDARLSVEDISAKLQKYAENVHFDADRLEQIRSRLAALNSLKKKYGGSLAAVIEYRQSLGKEISILQNLEQSINELASQIETDRATLGESAYQMSMLRDQAARELSDKVTRELAVLGMERAEFKVALENHETDQPLYVNCGDQRVSVSAKGFDHVEFFIRTNPGEPFKPLADVASGGEISRIMLALKTLLAESDQVPVLIFDEIDAGISGRVAQAAGLSLRRLSLSHQLICITHLPQIASAAQHHYLVEKFSDEVTTKTKIRRLAENERREQIARLFGGESVTEAHLRSAAELIQEAEMLMNQEISQ